MGAVYREIVTTGDNQRNAAASFQRRSANSKLSLVLQKPFRGRFQTFPQPPYVCSTYVSIDATCPDECRFKNAGCYVQAGNAGAAMKRLDKGARNRRGIHPNLLESNLIDMQWNSGYFKQPQRVPQDGKHGGRDLRLHVGGDVLDAQGATYLALAAELWKRRDGGMVWTYTHRWRDVPVEAWGPEIAALASVETVGEAEEAIDLGYMPSFTMASFERETAYRLTGGVKVVPCPAQTRNLKCVDCRLCFKPRPKGTAIGFAWHGRGVEGKRRLDVIQKEQYGQARLTFDLPHFTPTRVSEVPPSPRRFKAPKPPRTRFKCPRCGKLTGGRIPHGGDGSFRYPRRHDGADGKPCPGNIEEATWVTV